MRVALTLGAHRHACWRRRSTSSSGAAARFRAADARKLVAAGARLLDVRSPEEYAGGHLPGAVNIPVQELDRRLAEVGPRDGEVDPLLSQRQPQRPRRRDVAPATASARVHNLGPMTAW